jgi:tRNA1Val (adenine37-N6)-methyltransferase
VVSNPPWWTRREKSPGIARRIARHDDFLSLEELTNIIGRIISPGGITFLLIPDPESGRMESILADLGFHISSKCLICTRRGQPFSRVIYGFSRIPSRVKVSEICIYGPDESYSDKFRELLGEFYLAL